VTVEVLSRSAVVVGAAAADRNKAIDLVGSLLVAEGCVTSAYIGQMQQREEIVSTYLGNGIALPHGTSESKDSVKRTGLAVAQFPDGVDWGEERAHLVIGLAATSDEHIRVLARLGTILGDEGLCRRLGSTRDAGEIYRTLTAAETDDAPPSNGHPARSDEIERELKITNPHGLHARPAANVVDRVRPFDKRLRSTRTGGRRTPGASQLSSVSEPPSAMTCASSLAVQMPRAPRRLSPRS